MVVVATELPAAEDGEPAEEDELADRPDSWRSGLFVTRPQLRVLARHGAAGGGQGTAAVPAVRQPARPAGHICPAQNGHRPGAP